MYTFCVSTCHTGLLRCMFCVHLHKFSFRFSAATNGVISSYEILYSVGAVSTLENILNVTSVTES